MAVLQEYKCPCCGGAIAFDSSLQKMKCPYCDTEFEMETLAGYDNELKNQPQEDMSWDTLAGNEWQDDEATGLLTFVCKSCGGEIVGDETPAVIYAGLEYMADQFVYQLSEGNYYDAFVRYGELCDDFITQARSGQPYYVGNLPKAPFGFIKNLLITFAVGLVAALIITGRMKNKLKSVHMQKEAKDYVKTGSMHITQSNDLFLYAHVDRVAKPTESRSGGSSTHVSSSGTTHGGGGGKF